MTTARQIADEAMANLGVSAWRLRRGAARQRYEALIERRRIIRKAFDKVRYTDAPSKTVFLEALIGRIPITSDLLAIARNVVAGQTARD